MSSCLFEPPPPVLASIAGSQVRYPIRRIFCVGRNYAEHAAEMGVAVDREAPFYFTKPASAYVPSGSTIPYPPATSNYHYEMELVVALGGPAFRVPAARALDAVYGYACGLDMTRRDLQLEARARQRPWDVGKAFEQSAVLAGIVPAERFGAVGGQAISLRVNGARKQSARLSDLVWSVPELIAHLSTLYHLEAGDLIFTGTPAGVGPVEPGDRIDGSIHGCPPVELVIAAPEGTAGHG